jgi:geranylgeranyl diphosphate synthase type I
VSVNGDLRHLEAPAPLVRHRELVSRGVHEAVDRLPALIRRPVAYHLGWEDRDGQPVQGDGGKALRPAIALVAAEAVGGRAGDALPGAVAVELVHNFSLLHDDVMDGDLERRHRPTVWATFDVATAVVAGDALMTLAQQLLLEGETEASRRAAAELTRATAEMIEGQAEDLSFERRQEVREDESLAMSAHKTAALISCAAAMGAMLGGGSDPSVDALRRFGRHLGLAFQAVDDVLGIWGEPAVTGKPAANDLRQHKKSMPVVRALSVGGPATAHLHGVLDQETELTDEAVNAALVALEEAEARRWTLEVADRNLASALDALDGADLRPDPVRELAEIARFVTGRDF